MSFGAALRRLKVGLVGIPRIPAARRNGLPITRAWLSPDCLWKTFPKQPSRLKTRSLSWQKLSQAAPTNAFYRTRLLRASVALATFQILNRQPQAAIATSLHALQLDNSMVEFRALLAIGYCLNGQKNEANAILLENKDLKVGPTQTFTEAVLDDLHRLAERGIIHPDLGKIEKLMKAD